MLVLAATPSLAASINHGDFGPDFPPGILMYQGVTESSGTDPLPPARYGVPTITGDTLDFDPKEFVASATGGGLDITDVQLNFTLMSLPLTGITSLMISEEGDFTLFGGGTALTQVGAGLSIFVDIMAVDGVTLATPLSINLSTFFSANLVADGPTMNEPWDNSLFVDLGAALVNADIPYQWGVSKAEIVIDDQLLAISELASIAFISKKDFTIAPTVIIDPEFLLPEPSSMAMMVFALAGFGAAFRRRLWRGCR
jgi:PEP-CTERM motif